MRRVNLIPMAGEGQRFLDEGYNIPKPLIDINGLPMIVRAAKCLPPADLWIFICRDNHIQNHKIDKILSKYFPGAIIITVDKLTEGQASTCLLAQDYLFPNDMLTIGACDNGMFYNKNKFDSNLENHDALIWTFRNNPLVLQNPEMYGWVSVNESRLVTGVSCKTPISDNYIDDHAIVGCFTFKKAEYFVECANIMINKNRRINNEFYLDIVLDECVLNGYSVSPFEIDNYICWGTPTDLEKYLTNNV